MATILTVSRKRKFRFFEQAVLVKFAIVEKKTSSPRVPPMMRTLSMNRLKHHLPVIGNFSFIASNDF